MKQLAPGGDAGGWMEDGRCALDGGIWWTIVFPPGRGKLGVYGPSAKTIASLGFCSMPFVDVPGEKRKRRQRGVMHPQTSCGLHLP